MNLNMREKPSSAAYLEMKELLDELREWAAKYGATVASSQESPLPGEWERLFVERLSLEVAEEAVNLSRGRALENAMGRLVETAIKSMEKKRGRITHLFSESNVDRFQNSIHRSVVYTLVIHGIKRVCGEDGVMDEEKI